MKKFFPIVTALIAICGAGAAHPADLPDVKGPPVYAPPPPPAFSWTGGYVGLNAGYGWNDPGASLIGLGGSAWDGYYPPLGSYSFKRDGFIGGSQSGFNYQVGSFVFGVEGDFQYSDISGSSYTTGTGFGGYAVTLQQRMDWFGTDRVRLGFTPTDRLLVYATGGLAVGRISTTSQLDFTGSNHYDQYGGQTRAGWTAGGGVEYAFTNNWTPKIEYLYYDLGTTTLMANGNPSDAPYQTQTGFQTRGSIVRAGINYKFDLSALLSGL
jgi:outer membrane immunogenic protein